MAKRPVLQELTLVYPLPHNEKVLMILASTISVPFPGYLLSGSGPELLLRLDRRF